MLDLLLEEAAKVGRTARAGLDLLFVDFERGDTAAEQDIGDSVGAGAVERLLLRSYPRLLAADYPPSVMVTAVPLLARAQPGLLASGRYFVAEGANGRVLAAGGWSSGRAGEPRIAYQP